MSPGEQSADSSEPAQTHRYERMTSRIKTDAVLRLLRGESAETVSQELGVSVRRVERWKDSFVAAGSAELAKRKDVPAQSWAANHLGGPLRQWIWLLVALVAVISVLVVLLQRGSQE
jgi:hypothetical protein